MWTADALSRAPVEPAESMEEEVEAYVQVVTGLLPASGNYLKEIESAQRDDRVCRQMIEYCTKSWPSNNIIPPEIASYFKYRDSLTVQDNMLVKDNRLVIPKTLWKKVLCQLHTGHQGVSKSRERAKMSVWWPGLSAQIQEIVANCPTFIQ